MFLPSSSRKPEGRPLSPALALRVAILGMVALGAFGVLIFRLWAMQVLAAPQFQHEARQNQVRDLRLPAPRGAILDASGQPLVRNRAGLDVQIDASRLRTPSARLTVLRRLAPLTNLTPRKAEAHIRWQLQKVDPFQPVTVASDVPTETALYLKENARRFPGVRVLPSSLRYYPNHRLGAHLFGSLGPISADRLTSARYRGYKPGDTIGLTGLEATYDAYLRGRDGDLQVSVDAAGVPQQAVQRPAPTPGLNLRLTIDKATQAAAEAALRRGIRLASSNGANAGALVAIDVKTGEILAMASAPSFDPNWFISPQRRRFQPSLRWVAKSPLTPSFDRAIAGTYPAGSTFKPFVAFAAASQGLMSPYTPLLCTGSVTYDGQQWRNFDRYIHQWIALPEALTQSCDTYFYQLGYEIYKLPPRAGHPIQDWARKFGFGTVPGVDVSGAAKGRLPTPAWKRSFFTDAWSREWRSGDSVNLAIGQGDLLVTPLQMVQAYAAIANGGIVVTPHLANDVETATGDVKRKFVFPTRQLNLPAGVLPAIQTGLEGVTHAKTGTASALFAKFPIDVAGKTGTAQKPPQPDYSWFVSYAPANDPKIAVAVIIERGGHGGTAAAPTALDFYQRYFHTRQQPIAPIADQSG